MEIFGNVWNRFTVRPGAPFIITDSLRLVEIVNVQWEYVFSFHMRSWRLLRVHSALSFSKAYCWVPWVHNQESIFGSISKHYLLGNRIQPWFLIATALPSWLGLCFMLTVHKCTVMTSFMYGAYLLYLLLLVLWKMFSHSNFHSASYQKGTCEAKM